MEVLLKLKEFILESRRVFRVTRKPSSEELKTIVKVSGIGILLIGFIGFTLQLAAEIIKRAR